MTDSMYDKLGDLLKAALEKGEIPKSGEKKAETNAGTDERSYAFETVSYTHLTLPTTSRV